MKSYLNKILHPSLVPHGLVFTNGVFDILHIGHIHLLQQAKELTNNTPLVVALNTDQSTKRLKGKTRPINTLSYRLRTMAALEFVDYVTWFDEDTPESIILKLKPSTIIKGGDYTVETIVGSNIVDTTLVVPFTDDISTTKILEEFLKDD